MTDRQPQSRTELPHPVCAQCGVCELIGHSYDQQLIRKHQRLTRLFSAMAAVAPVLAAPEPLGYRVTAKLQPATDPLRIGIFAPGTHEVVDLSHCPVHHPLINTAIRKTRELLQRYRVSIHDEQTHSGLLRGLMFRAFPNEKQVGVALVTAPARRYRNRDFKKFLAALPGVLSLKFLVEKINRTEGNSFWGDPEPLRVHAGQVMMTTRYQGLELQIPGTSFWQANPAMATLAYDLIIQAASEVDGPVLELYSGYALPGLVLARNGWQVLAVEIDPAGVEAARASAELYALEHFQAEVADVETDQNWLRDFDPAVVLVNPPRKGLAPKVRELLLELPQARRLIYMSCNPATLYRDLEALQKVWAVSAFQSLDMFPGSVHLETVVVLDHLS